MGDEGWCVEMEFDVCGCCCYFECYFECCFVFGVCVVDVGDVWFLEVVVFVEIVRVVFFDVEFCGV